VEIALAPGISRPLVIAFPDGKPRETTVLGLKVKPVRFEHGDPYYPGKSAVAALADGEVRRLFLCTHDGRLAAIAMVDGKESGPVEVKLKPPGTVTGRIVDKDGNPIEGVGFQYFFDDGPGRPGVFVHGSSAIRALTPAEIERTGRTTGYYERDFRYST